MIIISLEIYTILNWYDNYVFREIWIKCEISYILKTFAIKYLFLQWYISHASHIYNLYICFVICFTSMRHYIRDAGWLVHRGQHISSDVLVLIFIHEGCGLVSGCGFVHRGQRCMYTKYQIFSQIIYRYIWGMCCV